MALALPYPDLDFVPLDILTAEELNEIVANYTYISNQFPLASDKLDLTTFPSLQDGVYKDPITGLMIVAKTFTGTVTSNTDLFGMKVGILPAFSFGETFAEPPTVSVTVRPTTATSFWQSGYGPGNITNTGIAANSFCVVRNNERDLPYQANIIAIGRYK